MAEVPGGDTLPPPTVPSWPPGWYPDPWYPGQARLWDGQAWTTQVTPAWASGPLAATATAAPPPTASPAATPPRRTIPWVAILCLVVASTLLAGVVTAVVERHRGGGVAAGSTTPNSPATSPQAAPPMPVSKDHDARILTKLGVTPADVGDAYGLVLMNGGNEVAGQATLDLCNGTYPSEAQRTARYQVAVVDSIGTTLLSTEAVLYRNPDGTAEAFTELRQVTAACPDRAVPSPVGEQPVETVFGPAPDASWPATRGVERLAFAFTTSSGQGTTRAIAVYLRRGRVLLGIYVGGDSAVVPTIAGQSTIPGIVSLLAARLAALPSSVIKG